MLTANQEGVLLNLNDTELRYFAEDAIGNVTIVSDSNTQIYKFSNSISDVLNPVIEPTDGQITLSWDNAASPSYQGAIIRRSLTEFPADLNQGTEILKTDASVNSHIDLNVQNGTTYYYTIFAFDDAIPANTSLGSRLSATPLDNIPPAVAAFILSRRW